MSFYVGSAQDQLSIFQKALYAKSLPIMGEEFSLRHKPGQPFINALPMAPNQGAWTAELRKNLIREEAKELCNALDSESKEQVAKETADLLYVAIANAVLYGFDLSAVFNRVHANNMEKMLKGKIDTTTGKLLKPNGHPKVFLSDLM